MALMVFHSVITKNYGAHLARETGVPTTKWVDLDFNS